MYKQTIDVKKTKWHKIFSVLQILTEFLQRTMKAKVTAVAKAHPPWFHSLSLPWRKAWWQGKTLFLYLAVQRALYLFDRGREITGKQSGERGEIFFLRKWFMGSRLCNSWVNNVLWVSLGVCSARVCVSIGNKSLSRLTGVSLALQQLQQDAEVVKMLWLSADHGSEWSTDVQYQTPPDSIGL